MGLVGVASDGDGAYARRVTTRAAAIAVSVIEAVDQGASAAPGCPDALADEVAQRVVDLRRAAGWQPLGWKIGATNRAVMQELGIDRPVVAPVYDATVVWAGGSVGAVRLRRMQGPRLEPELVLVLASPPDVGMDEERLFGCVRAVAIGFEVVQSPYPGWRCSRADAIAAGGLHGALLIGTEVARSTVTVSSCARLRSFCAARVVRGCTARPAMCWAARCLRCELHSRARHRSRSGRGRL
jgi:2-keto-4-pentenoate hydratase